MTLQKQLEDEVVRLAQANASFVKQIGNLTKENLQLTNDLLDRYAGQAMQSITLAYYTNGETCAAVRKLAETDGVGTDVILSKMSFDIAKAMLVERSKRAQ